MKNYPQVRKFDRPHSVTINPHSPPEVRPQEHSETFKQAEVEKKHLERYLKNGRICVTKENFLYFWSQDQYSLRLFLPIQNNVKGSDVKIDLKEEHICVNFGDNKTGSGFFTGSLRHCVHCDEDSWDWEILRVQISLKSCLNYQNRLLEFDTNTQEATKSTPMEIEPYRRFCEEIGGELYIKTKGIELNLRKKQTFNTAFIWWDCIRKDDDRINPLNIQERNHKSALSFQEAWEKAHEQFVRQTHEKTQICVD